MTDMLIHTLVWTGVLIAAVLVLRRPVSRHFGPEAAYALWALPLLRLIVPPVTLPAWMAPAKTPAAPELTAAPPASDPALWQTAAAAPPTGAVPAPLTVPMEAPAPAPEGGFDLFALLADWPILEALLTLWLSGAAVFLAMRFAAYFSLRDGLLAKGRELGRTRGLFGMPVRLVETPATNAPLAMGVLDPVIVLPPGFLALHDRTGRDLALAHELAHHRGGDLLVNILVQPLFALHWWNPLGRYGWLALRRDQEAACDARVMARRGAQEKAAYAALIARFAAAPGTAHHAALTAPMACPVLGEKSIIHRLRSLAMSDLSPRRRMAGRALLGAGLLALPLTASITYAAGENDSIFEAPEPPAPPSPPEAPQPPEAPTPPAPPSVLLIDPDAPGAPGDTQVTERVWRDATGKERRVKIVTRGRPDTEALARELEGMEHLDKAEREAMLAEVRASLAEADKALADLPRIIAEAEASAASARAEAGRQPRVIVKHECKPGSEEVSEITTKEGTQIVSICQKRIYATAVMGLREARDEIAADKDIPEETRKQLLRTLDSQISRWNGGKEG
ncbi:MAG: M56 family metallopeptidase [Erythrobacter sp.]|uniref:M56 family metallopeptidase n=1 Tax=Erythrobacter sp. TaxID=1042 RepID=UPI0025E692A3|nr:M56 family metallopeptidase [Erythrobacter sp.]MCM0000398.1 M56 family metallopeptidase [Erythrobacter sp.]